MGLALFFQLFLVLQNGIWLLVASSYRIILRLPSAVAVVASAVFSSGDSTLCPIKNM